MAVKIDFEGGLIAVSVNEGRPKFYFGRPDAFDIKYYASGKSLRNDLVNFIIEINGDRYVSAWQDLRLGGEVLEIKKIEGEHAEMPIGGIIGGVKIPLRERQVAPLMYDFVAKFFSSNI